MTEIVRARSALTPYFKGRSITHPVPFEAHAIHSSLYGVDIDPGAIEIAKLVFGSPLSLRGRPQTDQAVAKPRLQGDARERLVEDYGVSTIRREVCPWSVLEKEQAETLRTRQQEVAEGVPSAPFGRQADSSEEGRAG